MKRIMHMSSNLSRLIFLILFVSVIACTKDGGEDESTQIVGSWSISDVKVDVEIDGTPIDDYLENGGLTEAQENELTDQYQALLDGQPDNGDIITFKSDYTYSADFGDGVDTGAWSYDTKTGFITLVPSDPDDDTVSLKVLSVDSTTLVVGETQVMPEDVNDDGTDEMIDISTQIRLAKS